MTVVALWTDDDTLALIADLRAKLARAEQLLEHPVTPGLHPPMVYASDLREALR